MTSNINSYSGGLGRKNFPCEYVNLSLLLFYTYSSRNFELKTSGFENREGHIYSPTLIRKSIERRISNK